MCIYWPGWGAPPDSSAQPSHHVGKGPKGRDFPASAPAHVVAKPLTVEPPRRLSGQNELNEIHCRMLSSPQTRAKRVFWAKNHAYDCCIGRRLLIV